MARRTIGARPRYEWYVNQKGWVRSQRIAAGVHTRYHDKGIDNAPHGYEQGDNPINHPWERVNVKASAAKAGVISLRDAYLQDPRKALSAIDADTGNPHGYDLYMEHVRASNAKATGYESRIVHSYNGKEVVRNFPRPFPQELLPAIAIARQEGKHLKTWTPPDVEKLLGKDRGKEQAVSG